MFMRTYYYEIIRTTAANTAKNLLKTICRSCVTNEPTCFWHDLKYYHIVSCLPVVPVEKQVGPFWPPWRWNGNRILILPVVFVFRVHAYAVRFCRTLADWNGWKCHDVISDHCMTWLFGGGMLSVAHRWPVYGVLYCMIFRIPTESLVYLSEMGLSKIKTNEFNELNLV